MRHRTLAVGDVVRFEHREFLVVALAGNIVTIRDDDGSQSCWNLPELIASAAVDGAADIRPRPILEPGLSAHPSYEQAVQRERHILESLGRPQPGADAPLPHYDASLTTQAQRDVSKVAELQSIGESISMRTWQRLRSAYVEHGLAGLLDTRRGRPTGSSKVDERVIAAMHRSIEARTNDSTRTKGWVIDDVSRRIDRDWPDDPPRLPGRATLYRLMDHVSRGRATFGEGATRRSLANSPAAPFAVTQAYRPGERIEIDSTRADLLVLTPDGRQVRPELTVAVDTATRSICAAHLDYSTDSTDLTLMLAEMVAPRRSHPDWPEQLAYLHRLVAPSGRLTDVEHRAAAHAMHAIVVPETIVADLGPPYRSRQFRRACGFLGISLEPARPAMPTDKATVERTIGTINLRFCQHQPGYTGRNAAHRGDAVAALTLEQAQDLLDEWIAVEWQRRPHHGLRTAWGGAELSPNDLHAHFVSYTGRLSLPLTSADYVSLLPHKWIAVHRYGVNHDRRIYDSPDLDQLRNTRNPANNANGKWALHYHPHNIFRAWLAGPNGWIPLDWNHRSLFTQPFGASFWAEARRQAPTTDEETIARTALALQDKLFDGDQPSSRSSGSDGQSIADDPDPPDSEPSGGSGPQDENQTGWLDNFDPRDGLA